MSLKFGDHWWMRAFSSSQFKSHTKTYFQLVFNSQILTGGRWNYEISENNPNSTLTFPTQLANFTYTGSCLHENCSWDFMVCFVETGHTRHILWHIDHRSRYSVTERFAISLQRTLDQLEFQALKRQKPISPRHNAEHKWRNISESCSDRTGRGRPSLLRRSSLLVIALWRLSRGMT